MAIFFGGHPCPPTSSGQVTRSKVRRACRARAACPPSRFAIAPLPGHAACGHPWRFWPSPSMARVRGGRALYLVRVFGSCLPLPHPASWASGAPAPRCAGFAGDGRPGRPPLRPLPLLWPRLAATRPRSRWPPLRSGRSPQCLFALLRVQLPRARPAPVAIHGQHREASYLRPSFCVHAGRARLRPKPPSNCLGRPRNWTLRALAFVFHRHRHPLTGIHAGPHCGPSMARARVAPAAFQNSSQHFTKLPVDSFHRATDLHHVERVLRHPCRPLPAIHGRL